MGLSSLLNKSSEGSSPGFQIISTSINNCDNVHKTSSFAKLIVGKPASSASEIVWIFVLAIMAAFFMAAAYVQHNDPDPYLWMPVYLVPCLINCVLLIVSLRPTTLATASKPFWKIINCINTIHICYCYALGLWTLVHYVYRQLWEDEDAGYVAKIVSEPHMQMEEAKELIGLCLVIAWLSFINNGIFLKVGTKGIFIGSLLTGLPIISWMLVEKLEENRERTCLF